MISFIPQPALPQFSSPDPLAKSSNLTIEQVYCDISKTHPGWEINNKYSVYNMQGEQLFYAFEDSCRFVRFFCARSRPFIIHIVDKDNTEVIRLYRDFKCCSQFSCRNWFAGCSRCCSNEIFVESPPGNPIGSFWKARYEVLNECENPLFDLIGPCQNGYERFCFKECNTDYTFYRSGCNQVVGTINKSHSEPLKCCVTRKHKTNSCFSADINEKEKKLILASMFLVELLYYDKGASDNRAPCCS